MKSLNRKPIRSLSAILIFTCIILSTGYAQNVVTGSLVDSNSEGIAFVTCAVYHPTDSTLLKVEFTDKNGYFKLDNILADRCYAVFSYIGYQDLVVDDVFFDKEQEIDLGVQVLKLSEEQLETVVVTAERSLIETKADRVIFNVAGTINTTGDNATQVLRKAPGVNIGGNGAYKLLGREGVLFYIDGKLSPLTGEEISDFLDNLSSEQIDRIEIIHNPGVKYDAQGKAGIIDIKLVKNDRWGYNSDLSLSLSQGRRNIYRVGSNINYKNKHFNLFGSAGYRDRNSWSSLVLASEIADFSVREALGYEINSTGYRVRYGMDYFINPHHTLGLLGSRVDDVFSLGINGDTEIGIISTASIDSVLISGHNTARDRTIDNINLNYVFDNAPHNITVDFDYGQYFKDSETDQPNSYFEPDRTSFLRASDKFYTSEISIDILSAKIDYERKILGGDLSLGTKWVQVNTLNEFLFYDKNLSQISLNSQRSNKFNYDEKISAGYLSYSKRLNENLNYSIGTRMEHTNSTGELKAIDDPIDIEPIKRNYLNLFPNLNINYSLNPNQSLSLSYGRRINRPNYRRLNPFKAQVNELGFDKGNPFLRPEISDNIDLGFTMNQSYHFKLSYSRTKDKIVTLIAPDDDSPIAGFLGYDNLAFQDIFSFNASGPFSITDNIRVNNNVTLSYNDSYADYGDGVTIANDAFNFSFNQSYDYKINNNFSSSLSAWYTSSDLWDGIQYSRPNFSISTGLKCSLLERRLSILFNVNDIFYTERFKAESVFAGRSASMLSLDDTRRVSLSIRYVFGNSKVKSRRRNTGNEDEKKRA